MIRLSTMLLLEEEKIFDYAISRAMAKTSLIVLCGRLKRSVKSSAKFSTRRRRRQLSLHSKPFGKMRLLHGGFL